MTGSSQAAAPEWYTSGSHPRYVQEFYFVGVGSGDSYDAAIEQASAQISRQIEVKVEAESNNVVSSYTEDDREHIRSQYESVSRSFTENTLRSAEVSEKAIAGDIHYVLITIDKSKYVTSLKADLDGRRSEIEGQYSDSEALLEEGRFIQVLQNMIDTGDAATKLHARALIYTSISGKPYLSDEIISGPAILSKCRKLIGKIRLEKISGSGQTGQSGKLLPEPIVVKASLKQKDGAIPLKNLRLALKDEDNKVLERLHTDDQGVAKFWIYAVGEDKGKVTAGIDLLWIHDIFRKDFRDIQAAFKYDITSIPPMKFTVHVEDEQGVRLEQAEDIVSKSVQAAGHHVSDDAPFMLVGRVIVTDVRQVDGLDGTQHLVKTELTLFIKDKKSGERVGSIVLAGKGMDKASEKTALNKSYKKLKISKNDMTKALAAAADKLNPIRLRLSGEALEAGKKLYEEGKYHLALQKLAQVTDGEEIIAEADKLIVEIKAQMEEKETGAIK